MKGCERMKKEWDYAARPRNFWTAPNATTKTKVELANAAAKPLSPYKAALLEMDEKRIRDASTKQ